MTRIQVTLRMIPTLAFSLFVLACTDDTVSDEQSSETGSADTSTPGEGDGDPGDGDGDPGDGDGDPGDGDPGDGDPGDGDPGDGDGDPGDGDGDGDGGTVDPEGIEAACKDLCTISNMCDGEDPECEWECLDIFDWFGRECAPFMVSWAECIAALDCAGYDAWGTGDPFGAADYPCKAEDLGVLSCGL